MKSTLFTTIKQYISFLGLFILMGSCKKFLDQKPITEVDTKMVFTDVNSTLKAIAGVYGRMAGDNAYGLKLALHYPVDEDILMGPSGNNDDRRGMAHYSLTTLNTELPAPFNQLFEGISFANICIYEIPKMDMYTNGTDQQKKQLRRMYGEALTLRAQFYYDALRNWGDLPEHFLPSYLEAATTPFPIRKDKDMLCDKILEDLKTAADLVPWRNEVVAIGDPLDERITKGTVKGLRARIALFRGGYALKQSGAIDRSADYVKFYQIARDETNDIINSGNHALFPSYKGLWKDVVCSKATADPNGELMFQVTAIGGGGTADSKFGYANGPRVNGLGNSFVNPLPQYFYLFDSTDLRRDVTIAPYNVAADGVTKIGVKISDMRDGKYRRDWIKPVIAPNSQVQYFGLKWQLLRYADVLLMFAEAENEINGPTAAAYNAINMVRRRGYGKAITTADALVDLPAGLAKADFFKAIVRERALELGAEGIRKYDLLRWNLLAKGIAEAKTNMANMSKSAGTLAFTYMAAPPAYASNLAVLPQKMYYKLTATADDANIWSNSLYKVAPVATPTGTASIAWVSTTIGTDITSSSTRYAFGFLSGKSELFPIPQPARDANPKLTQNPGY